ncbi:MAG: glycosyltransferase [Pseudomonadota bacterium]
MLESERHWTKRLGVVLVTFNSADVIQKSIWSVPSSVEVVVVDNASSDDTVARVHETGVRYICNEENIGFARASNIGAAVFNHEFILFLNPDAELYPDTLETLMETAIHFSDAAAIAPKLVNVGDRLPWRFSSVLHPYVGPRRRPIEPESTCCLPLLTGAVFLSRRAAFEAVGGFDENIFLYHEDDDLCVRLTRAGWSLIYEPNTEAFHASGCSSNPSLKLVRFKSEQRLISNAYVSKKYGLVFNAGRELRRTLKRLLIAVLLFDSKRRSAAFGRLDALRILRNQKTEILNARDFSVGIRNE